MKKFTILGRSNSQLAMIIECLYKKLGKDIHVEVVENVPPDDKLPYYIEGIELEVSDHKNWIFKPGENNLILGVYKVATKKVVSDFFSQNFGIQPDQFISLVFPGVEFSSTGVFGHGSTVGPGCVFGPYSSIGNFVSINRNVSIGHHSTIGDFSTVNPGVNIAGCCEISAGVTIGIGTNIVDNICIGDNTIIGAGSLVTRSIPAGCVAYGVPAKIIRHTQ